MRAARKRWPLIVGLVAGVLVLALGGVAYATFRYEQANAGRMLIGTTIDSVDVSGMTRAEAIAAVRARPRTSTERSWSSCRANASPRRLGSWASAHGSARRSTERWMPPMGSAGSNGPGGASGTTPSTSTSSSTWPGTAAWRDSSVARRGRCASITPERVDRDGRGGLFFVHAKAGKELEVRRAERLLAEALDDGSATVRLSVRSVAPKFTEDTMLPTIVVHVDTNRLDLYEGFDVTHSWDVATAKPGWTTPVGEWSLYQAREPDLVQPGARQLGRDHARRGPRWARQPDVRRPSTSRPRSHPDPRDHLARFDRPIRVPRLHPDAQRAGGRALRPRSRWGEGHHHGVSTLVGIEGDFPDTPDGSDTVA